MLQLQGNKFILVILSIYDRIGTVKVVLASGFVGEASEAQLSPIPSGHLTACPLCRIGQRIVWQFRDKVIYLLSIYSQIRTFIEYGNKDTANT